MPGLRIFMGSSSRSRAEPRRVHGRHRRAVARRRQQGRRLRVLDMRPNFALRRHAYLDAYRTAMECHAGEPQNPEVPFRWRWQPPSARAIPRRFATSLEDRPLAGSGTSLPSRSEAHRPRWPPRGRRRSGGRTPQQVHAELVRLGQAMGRGLRDRRGCASPGSAPASRARRSRPPAARGARGRRRSRGSRCRAGLGSIGFQRSARYGIGSSTTTAMTRLVRSAYSA